MEIYVEVFFFMKRFLGTAKLTHNDFWLNGIGECVTIYCTVQ